MLIPEQYPAFHKKTLVVVSDHVHAKLFLGNDREFTFITEFKTDYPSHEGGDRTSMVTPGGQHSAEKNEKEFMLGEDHLFHRLAKNLYERLEKNEFEDLIIAAGQEVHQLEKMLHHDVQARITKLIPKLLTKMNDDQLLEHLF
ncbi:hypothetical protein A3C09_02405 [Candidatus Uhrbacteria bacterium RIFCSPHIGHO2_02_FULL_47_44]|uniref:Host attachment protein n=1 Tax=Candidatus Uhrbacteria bacterium RIFCSPLOWO2_02_FULL_48_18 TaxID=1802408 RepID=A0A1F7V7G0_9BACT|nr:MAG: hypothetical protein A2839_04245 [Candidatus Uhrbacteria bacterium RIFCSPHIGHO2_01_FULL_47_10]OGL71205.1 MAG: hypothetical protein A3C09_02405 [Candidatus Uhrbacteria bacterium RIFCSPHIGHO2_02_FULL_47_44]OGL77275.1 MAG: hypothetical protein A3E97_01245 [Candidatus Uhrbacteria bacterium RIFCSPHIGHO2_12_FULL_47_12]OGL80501.1 MAG: hypothetical protein A3B20_03790 [Candidatus Uhrbacteria bacterium RIFCSPLOWO2_01_FULL_47_17]OGL86361.1 MAG: hypothetical protein A3I41_02270 [Candidatus Uhrbact